MVAATARHGIASQHIVIEIVAAQQHAEYADPRVQKNAARQQVASQPGGQDLAAVFDAENQGVENEGGGENDTGLKAAARPKITVKLNVKCEQQNVRNHKFGGDAQDGMPVHTSSSRSSGTTVRRWPGRHRLRPRPKRTRTPIAAVKITTVSPKVS